MLLDVRGLHSDWGAQFFSLPKAHAAHSSADRQHKSQYVLGALEYHCTLLAESYAEAAKHYTDLIQPIDREHEYATFGGRGGEYYEFDALVTACRRAYDSLRYIVWRCFGANGSMPSSFYRTIRACPKLPKDLLERCERSWQHFGIPITAYRDCIQHYCPIDFGLSYVTMVRVCGIWTSHVRIPDNPEARSRFAFLYLNNLDALTFSWEAASEVLALSGEIIEAIPAPESLASPK